MIPPKYGERTWDRDREGRDGGRERGREGGGGGGEGVRKGVLMKRGRERDTHTEGD